MLKKIVSISGLVLMLVLVSCRGSDGEPLIYVSDSPDRSSPRELEDTILLMDNPAYIFTIPHEDVVRVRFYLDDPLREGQVHQIEESPPYDLLGTNWNGESLPITWATPMDHSITVEYVYPDGDVEVLTVNFTVSAEVPTPQPSPTVGSSPSPQPTVEVTPQVTPQVTPGIVWSDDPDVNSAILREWTELIIAEIREDIQSVEGFVEEDWDFLLGGYSAEIGEPGLLLVQGLRDRLIEQENQMESQQLAFEGRIGVLDAELSRLRDLTDSLQRIDTGFGDPCDLLDEQTAILVPGLGVLPAEVFRDHYQCDPPIQVP